MSTTTKFTPGEWKVFDHYCGRDPETAGEYANHRLVGVGQFDTIADVRHGHDEIDGDVDANARLIAAAPCMYADLVEAERMFRWYGDLHAAKPDPEKASRNYEMADRLAATLAKVEAPRG